MAELEIKTNGEIGQGDDLRAMGKSLTAIATIIDAMNVDDRITYRFTTLTDSYGPTLVWTAQGDEGDLIAFIERIGPLAEYITVLTGGDESDEAMERFAALPVADIF
jgi:hypothetical protein